MNHGSIVYDCMLHMSAARPIDAIGIYLVNAKLGQSLCFQNPCAGEKRRFRAQQSEAC